MVGRDLLIYWLISKFVYNENVIISMVCETIFKPRGLFLIQSNTFILRECWEFWPIHCSIVNEVTYNNKYKHRIEIFSQKGQHRWRRISNFVTTSKLPTIHFSKRRCRKNKADCALASGLNRIIEFPVRTKFPSSGHHLRLHQCPISVSNSRVGCTWWNEVKQTV